MDGCKPERRLHKLAAVDSTRSPLVSAEKNNGRHKSPTPSTPSGSRHSRTREVSSRNKSPTPSTPSGSRRCPSPTPTRTTHTPSPGVQKRAVSAERKRSSTPPSLQIPSTPVHDSSIAVPISSRRLSIGRTPECLWPSTMRNLSASFQSDTLSPVSKKEKGKPVSNVSLDRTLRPSSNVARIQQSETSTLSRKPSPERKRNLLEGKNLPDQSENAKPVDGLPIRLIDHHLWPSRIGGKLSSNSLNTSVDQGDKIVKKLSTKRMPMSDNPGKPLKSSNDAARLLSLDDIGRVGFEESSTDDKSRRASFPASILSTSSLDKTMLTTSGPRFQSPSKTSVSRGVTPHWARPSTPTARGVSPTPRGVSPIRTRTSTSSSQSHSSTPVLSLTPRATSTSSTQSHSSTPVLSPTQMRTSTSSNQPHSSTSVLNSTLRVVSPTRVRTSTSSSQTHSSTSALSSTSMASSPTQMRTSTSSSQSHSSTSTSSSQSHSLTPILSSTPRVVSPIRVRTSTSSSQSHSSTSVLSSTPRVLSPTRMRTPTSSRRTHSRSHSSSSVLSSIPRGVSPTPRGVSPTPRGVSPTPRGVSPTPRGVSPTPRVVSPTRMRTSAPLSQSHSSTSVLSFITDFKKGRKSASYIEDAHQLHILYNRYLQWRFANAHAEDVLYIQKVNVEETLTNVWSATLGLCDALIKKKINLQRLKLELKLNSVLNHQMGYLNDWALLERDHISSLAGAEENLEGSTLRVPITGGAKADIKSLKAAICSAVDVMQAMGSSICSSLPKVEGINSRVSELAAIVAQEKNMLDQCKALLSSTAAMQLEESSISAHLMQTKQPLKKNKQPTMAAAAQTFPWP